VSQTFVPASRLRSEPRTWLAIAGITLLAACWMAAVDLRLDWQSAAVPLAVCLGMEGLATFYRVRRPEERLATMLTGVAQLVAFTAVAAPLSYALARNDLPFWDETFLSWDRALGLDWRAYLAFVDARPMLGLLFKIAYLSLTIQMVVIVLILGMTGRVQAVREFVWAVIIGGLATVLISGALPAMAMFVHLGLSSGDFPHLNPAAAFVHVEAINGLRDGTLKVITLGRLEGIITFPSFHAALGAIFAYALWGVRWIRFPALALNFVLIAATPIDGGHYFVDVLAGLAIAALAIGAARRLVRQRSARRFATGDTVLERA
jgi:membrane-associated phospholipid phosphatase